MKKKKKRKVKDEYRHLSPLKKLKSERYLKELRRVI